GIDCRRVGLRAASSPRSRLLQGRQYALPGGEHLADALAVLGGLSSCDGSVTSAARDPRRESFMSSSQMFFQLPAAYRSQSTLHLLSANAQIYVICKTCNWEDRANPMY